MTVLLTFAAAFAAGLAGRAIVIPVETAVYRACGGPGRPDSSIGGRLAMMAAIAIPVPVVIAIGVFVFSRVTYWQHGPSPVQLVVLTAACGIVLGVRQSRMTPGTVSYKFKVEEAARRQERQRVRDNEEIPW